MALFMDYCFFNNLGLTVKNYVFIFNFKLL
jgi:hypothetical protein